MCVQWHLECLECEVWWGGSPASDGRSRYSNWLVPRGQSAVGVLSLHWRKVRGQLPLELFFPPLAQQGSSRLHESRKIKAEVFSGLFKRAEWKLSLCTRARKVEKRWKLVHDHSWQNELLIWKYLNPEATSLLVLVCKANDSQWQDAIVNFYWEIAYIIYTSYMFETNVITGSVMTWINEVS